VLGVLDIRGGVDAALDESDIFTLQTLADQIAVAIENARLYETGQQLAVSEERNRLARELHDSVTQELFSMTMIAGALPALMERKPAVAKERVDRLHELSRGALAEMRALLFALRPAALAEEGLVSALSKHAAAFESREGIRVHLEVDGEGRLPQPCEEALYRIFGEALNNVVKHAKARNVWVQLAIGDDESALLVRDDGIGFDITPQTGVHTMGLTSMRERVAALNGDFRVESAPGQGTSIRVTVPVGVEQCVTAEAGV
jgi:signal transduction histidine kinase